MAAKAKSRTSWAIALLAALVIGAYWTALLSPVWRRALAGDNDFVVFYCGGQLAFSERLYEPAACFAVQKQIFGDSALPLTYIRMPFHALALAAVAWLPYQAAYFTFQFLQLMAVGWALWQLAQLRQDFLFFAAFCPALLLGFANGQDTGFLFALAVGAWLHLRQQRDFSAGLLLSLCAIKIHLFPLVVLALMLHGRWRALAGGALGGAALAALSFAANGNWPARFLGAVSNPAIHPNAGTTTTLYNAVQYFGGGWRLELLLALSVAAGFAWAARRLSFDVSYALALALGLLIGHHAYLQDTLLVLASLGILCAVQAPAALVRIGAFAALPPAAMAVLAGQPWSLVYPAALAGLLISACLLSPVHVSLASSSAQRA